MGKEWNILRWILLSAGIFFACLHLNGAMYAAWASSGPPTQNPEGWMFVAGNRLAWAIAYFLSGLGIFFLFSQDRYIRRIAPTTLFVVVLLATFPCVREFMASDACLDSGGKWLELRCVH